VSILSRLSLEVKEIREKVGEGVHLYSKRAEFADIFSKSGSASQCGRHRPWRL